MKCRRCGTDSACSWCGVGVVPSSLQPDPTYVPWLAIWQSDTAPVVTYEYVAYQQFGPVEVAL